MFRILLTVTIIGSAVWLYKAYKRANLGGRELWLRIKSEFSVFEKFNEIQPEQFLAKFRKSTYLLSLAFLLILAVSAYLQVLINGGPLSGWLLIIHVTCAPLFALSVMLSILAWAQRQRFQAQDLLCLQDALRRKNILPQHDSDLIFWNKVLFWIFMLTVIPAILSIILQLYPIFGAQGMENLLEIHRYSTLILFIVVMIHTGLLLLPLNK